MRIWLHSFLVTVALTAAPASTAQSAAEAARAEAAGTDAGVASAAVAVADPRLDLARGALVLVVPESTNDNVVLLNATTGDLISAAFLTDNAGLSTPTNAFQDVDGQGLLVCDQISDVAFRYTSAGAPEGVFAPAGGANNAILDNVRGCTTDGGTLYATTANGPNANAVATFDAAGTFLGNFISPGAGGLDSPYDVLFRTADVLVSASGSDVIHRYSRQGVFLDVFAGPFPFVQQLHETAAGTILGADFTTGVVVELTAAGVPVGTYTFAGVGGLRGVYELPSGSLLVTNGNGIYEVRRDGTVVRQIVAGVQGRFIEEFAPGGIVAGEAEAPASGGEAVLRVAGGNPFRLQTTLTLTVNRPQAVRVAVVDVTGRRVATLFDGRLGADTAQVLTLHGSGLPAGVYAVRATGETFTAVRTVTHVE